MTKSHRTATLVKTVLVDAIEMPSGNALEFRVEVFAWSDSEYSCVVWRLDMYRIKPTFYADHADEELPVLDNGIEWRKLRAASADALLNLLFEKIEQKLSVRISRS